MSSPESKNTCENSRENEPSVSPSIAVIQLAYYVPDIVAAAEHWAAHLGAGPFYTLSHIPLQSVRYGETPGELDHSSAYGWHGKHMVELVTQHGPASPVFGQRPYGLHHAAYVASHFDEELQRLAALGWPTAMVATTNNNMRFAFADANTSLGHYFELYEDADSIHDFYQFIEQASQGWDGKDPVRKL
jgi:hypothetical protein